MNGSKKLIKNLQIAVEKLRGLGKHHDMMSHYNSAEDLAVFIESQTAHLASHGVKKENLNELWRVFAPTSEWDDYVGDVELGESIFQDLDLLKSNY